MTKKRESEKDVPLRCCTCLKQIPKSAAYSFEGEDYIWFFCGSSCFEQWNSQTEQWLTKKKPVKKLSPKSQNHKKDK